MSLKGFFGELCHSTRYYVQDIEGMPAGGAARSLQSHRYGSFEENGDDDSDEEDVGRAFEMV